jgi:hypothetical protein
MQDKRNILEGLRRIPDILSEFVKTIPEDRLDLRRGEGFWTIAEHVGHLAHVQPMLLERFQRFVHEDHPVFVPYIPGTGKDEPQYPPRMELPAALAQFSDYRNQQLALLESADEATWQKMATHPEYDLYSFYILARHVLMHDYWHMYRMEELWLTKDDYLTTME